MQEANSKVVFIADPVIKPKSVIPFGRRLANTDIRLSSLDRDAVNG